MAAVYLNDVLRVHRSKEAGPARSALKLGIRREEREVAYGTNIHALLLVVMWVAIDSLACEGTFCPMMEDNVPAIENWTDQLRRQWPV